MRINEFLHRPKGRGDSFPSTRSFGAAVYERHAQKMHRDLKEALQAVFDGELTEADDSGDFTSMVRGHREGLLRRLDGDLRFQELVDRLQKLELLRELYERDPALVAFALRGRAVSGGSPNTATDSSAPQLGAEEDK